jgi:hypothetical protein
VPLRDLERLFPSVDSLEPLERAKADGSEEPARAVDDEDDGRQDVCDGGVDGARRAFLDGRGVDAEGDVVVVGD